MGNIGGSLGLIIGALMGILFVSLMAQMFPDAVGNALFENTPVSRDNPGGVQVSVPAAGTRALQTGSFLLPTQNFYRNARNTAGEIDRTVSPKGVMLTINGTGCLGLTYYIEDDRRTINYTFDRSAGSLRTCRIQGEYFALREDVTNTLWAIVPLLFVILFTGGILTLSMTAGGDRDGEGNMLKGVLVVIVGAVLIPVQIGFVSSAQAAYDTTPDFTGLSGATGGVIFPILNLAYLIVMISIAFSYFSGRTVWSRVSGGLNSGSGY